ncbi:hypothetical protein Kpol_1018p171 [Vanderwaltozyma polyspora DSM 70294]|uniref:Mitochondrial import protein 1 n=1 Tax=Vanderwaltozyma polyspora (strain ATCC 22028 / DSM 70294 / BCRC 21397 / CBS 2163 / NBRC 10782 / NRRL Y-8283 / UCD 57-17) TaxID=436907 RepID=A7TE11_VANPO|nr:uncharacterized protein Kpol_1018p171 [Vanderwaltozyma polyspora DSM 70294]EDO19631.1 hypothetical protein Kpol_1018p171 [Vanderwaltozyma polyspora DSM 70294]
MSQDKQVQSNQYTALLRFIRSSSINLILPFINGLMLGFGELVAHEISWRNNWFSRSNNKGYNIFPESRKSSFI